MVMTKIALASIACLLLQARLNEDATPSNITSDTYFYGQSPSVLPSPPVIGTGAWTEAVNKAKQFVAQLTQNEKANLTCGSIANNGCGGNIIAISRLGFQGLCLQDGSHGVHATDRANAYASEISVGARFVFIKPQTSP